MRALYVLYDDTCGFCVRCARWLRGQHALVPLQCLAEGSPEARQRFPGLRRGPQKQELVVVDERGGVYREAHAWLMVLWALEDYRPWALRLASPTLMPLARSLFAAVSSGRHRLSGLLHLQDDAEVRAALARTVGEHGPPRCVPGDGGACEVAERLPCVSCGRPLVRAGGPAVCPGCLAAVAAGREA